MSSKATSPAAAVLRSSRLFSMPAPLTRPDSAFQGLAGNRISNTATAPYPTQQTITTPPSSLARGDWGLKRPLPLRSTTRTSTPVIKIHSVDTREHITDFDSASDLSRTLDKFEELALPVTRADTSVGNQFNKPFRSVFEPDMDHTDPEAPSEDPQTGRQIKRWRYQGPYLARMSENEFQAYATKTLKDMKPDFLAFARRQAAQKKNQDRAQLARHSGQQAAEVTDDVSDEEFNDYLRELRSEGEGLSTGSRIVQLVNEFLDMPGARLGASIYDTAQDTTLSAPPPMHPSGGLGYMRTDAILSNHPIFGPRARPTPRPARILSQDDRTRAAPERIGLSGFVVNTQLSVVRRQGDDRRVRAYDLTPEQLEAPVEERLRLEQDLNLKSVGLGIQGGNRYWAEPQRVELGESGMVQMRVRNASSTSVGAHTMRVESGQVAPTLPKEGQSARKSEFKKLERMAGFDSARPSGGKRSYGFGSTKASADLGDDELKQSSLADYITRKTRSNP